MECLDPTTALELVEGTLPPEQEASAKAHLDDCAECREFFAELAKSHLSASAEPGKPAQAEQGHALGRYRLLQVIGTGAMGVVYLAHDPELDRNVALKLLHEQSGQASQTGSKEPSELERWMLGEGRALARLSHPNVVTVYDVGSADRRVFLVMELVEGTPLREWLRSPHTWREVLEIFLEAGKGLVAAHHAGLVHRDFKPDNVMVGADGRVRVMDFGLARPMVRPGVRSSVLGAPLRADGSSTQAGTPIYMAPEQLAGHRATAESDQFSFCVALYEGLYGVRPFEGLTLDELSGNMRADRVRDEPRGSFVPARVRRVLLRGLSALPAFRYPSMEALLEELRPLLSSRRKLVLRRGAVGALALSAALAGYVYARQSGSRVCGGAEGYLADVWDAEKKRAIEKALRASGAPFARDAWRQTERKLDLHAAAWVEMYTDACEATRIRQEQSEQVLDLRMACLDRHLRQMNALTKVLSEADRSVAEHAAEAVQSLKDLSECANVTALKAGVRPPRDAQTAKQVEEVRAVLARVRALEESWKYQEALALAREARERSKAVGYLPLEAEALYQRGRLEGLVHVDIARTEQTLRDAAEMAEVSGHHEVAAAVWSDLVYFVGFRGGRYDKAVQWNRYAASAIERMGGDALADAKRRHRYTTLLWRQGKKDEALQEAQEARKLLEKAPGHNPVEMAKVLDVLGILLAERGELDKSAELFRQAITFSEKGLGPNHPQVGRMLSNLANTLREHGRYRESIDALDRALQIIESAEGPEHLDAFAPNGNMAQVLAILGRYDAAMSHLQRVILILDKAGRRESPEFADALKEMGEVYRRRGDNARAVSFLRESLQLYEKMVGPNHPEAGVAQAHLAHARLSQGFYRDALDQAQRSLAIVEKSFGPDSHTVARVLTLLGRIHLAVHAPEKALEPLERALRIWKAHPGNPEDVAEASFALAQALWSTRRDQPRARALAAEARDVLARSSHLKPRLSAVNAWLAQR